MHLKSTCTPKTNFLYDRSLMCKQRPQSFSCLSISIAVLLQKCVIFFKKFKIAQMCRINNLGHTMININLHPCKPTPEWSKKNHLLGNHKMLKYYQEIRIHVPWIYISCQCYLCKLVSVGRMSDIVLQMTATQFISKEKHNYMSKLRSKF